MVFRDHHQSKCLARQAWHAMLEAQLQQKSTRPPRHYRYTQLPFVSH